MTWAGDTGAGPAAAARPGRPTQAVDPGTGTRAVGPHPVTRLRTQACQPE
jgi:hypothetical protein